MASLPSKAELLSSLEKLPYDERVKKAAALGNANKDKKELDSLISELRKHPTPSAVSVDVEEEFVQILPAKKTNVARYFLEDQIAINAAIAAKKKDVIEQELDSPSSMFKNLAVKAYVTLEKDDEVLFKKIVAAVPMARKKLIRRCIKLRKVKVLEKLLPLMKDQYGVDSAAAFLHGCSFDTIMAALKDADSPYRSSPKVNWKKVARYNGKVILNLLEADLEIGSKTESTEWNLVSIYSRYFTGILTTSVSNNEFVRRSGLSLELLKLWEKYPCYSYVGNTYPRPRIAKVAANQLQRMLPAVISLNLAFFIRRHTKEVTAILKSCTSVDHRKNLRTGLPSDFWQGKTWRRSKLRSKSYPFVKDILEDVLSKHTKTSFYYNHGYDYQCITGQWIHPSFLDNFSLEQLEEIRQIIIKFLVSIRPDVKSFASWNVKSTQFDSAGQKWTNAIAGIYTAFFTEVNYRQRRAVRRERLLSGDKADKPTSLERKRFKRDLWVNRTPEQVEAERKIIATQKKAIHDFRMTLLKEWVENWKASYFVFVPTQQKVKEEKKRLNAASRLNNKLIGGEDVDALKFVYKELLPYFEKGQEATFWRTSMQNYYFGLATALREIEQERRDHVSDEERSAAKTLRLALANDLFTRFSTTDPVENFITLVRIAEYADYALGVKIIKLYDAEQIVHLATVHSNKFLRFLNSLVFAEDSGKDSNRAEVWKLVTPLLEADVVSKLVRDSLLRYQDVQEHPIRKVLQKATDAKAAVERSAAYETLVFATIFSKSAVQIRRTLTFIRKKIKNEALENREEAIRYMMNPILASSDEKAKQVYTQMAFDKEAFEGWFSILADALEAPDLGTSTYLTDLFISLGKQAIAYAAKDGDKIGDSEVFDFGVELQWRIAQFRFGRRKLYEDFRIQMNPSMCDIVKNRYWNPGCESALADAVIAAYKKRVEAKNPKFFDRETIYSGLFSAVKRQWMNVEVLKNHLEKLLQLLVDPKRNDQDKDGLHIILDDDDVLSVFKTVFAFHHPRELRILPMYTKYLETMLQTRQAKRVVVKYVNLKGPRKPDHMRKRSRAEKRKGREEVVMKLLSVSKSAIHLRIVWGFLLRYRQDLLDEFLTGKEAYRGVFYVKPDQRGSSAIGQDQILERLKEEKKEVQEFNEAKLDFEFEEDAGIRGFDHEDLFCLPGSFGLHRLTPAQSQALEVQRRNQVLNPDLSLPERTAAAIRWTLLPTVDYPKIVDFYEKGSTQADPLAVNILEAIIRGSMYCDETVAPLRWLLSPKFLGSDRARVAMYSVASTLATVPTDRMTEMVKIILETKRRRVMKITAYKELIRILAGRPVKENVDMIVNEWNRKDLHRDVRITVVQQAINMLKYKTIEESCWTILEDAVTNTKNVELLAAVLGAKPQGVTDFAVSVDEIAKTPRLIDYFEELSKVHVPTHHCERFVRNIVVPLCGADQHEDIRHLAILLLPTWLDTFTAFDTKLNSQLVEYLYEIITTVGEEQLDNPRPKVQNIWNARYNSAATGIFHITATSNHRARSRGRNANRGEGDNQEERIRMYNEYLPKALDILVNAVKATKIDQREMRRNLYQRIHTFSSHVVSPGSPREEGFKKMLNSLATCTGDSRLEDKLIPIASTRIAVDANCAAKVTEVLTWFVQFAERDPVRNLSRAQNAIISFVRKADSYQESTRAFAWPIIDFLISRGVGDDENPAAGTGHLSFLATLLGVTPNEPKKPYPTSGLSSFARYLYTFGAMKALFNSSYLIKYKNGDKVLKLLESALRSRGQDGDDTYLRVIQSEQEEIVIRGLRQIFNENRTYYGKRRNRQIPLPYAKKAVGKVVNAYLADPEHGIAGAVLVSAGGDYLHECVTEDVLLKILRLQMWTAALSGEKSKVTKVAEFAKTLVNRIEFKGQSIMTEEDNEEFRKFQEETWRKTKLSLDFMGRILDGSAFSVGEGDDDKKKNTQIQSALSHVQLAVFIATPIFIIQREAAGKAFLTAWAESVLRRPFDYGSADIHGIMATLTTSIRTALERVKGSYSWDEEELEEKERKRQQSATETIAAFVRWCREGKDTKSPGAKNLLSEIGFSILEWAGGNMKVKKPEEGADEEEEAEESGKSKKDAKNKLAELEWRKEFEAELNAYCEDANPAAALRARKVVTKSFARL